MKQKGITVDTTYFSLIQIYTTRRTEIIEVLFSGVTISYAVDIALRRLLAVLVIGEAGRVE